MKACRSVKSSSGHNELHRQSQVFPEEIGVLTSSVIKTEWSLSCQSQSVVCYGSVTTFRSFYSGFYHFMNQRVWCYLSLNISLTQIFSAACKLVNLGKGNCCGIRKAQLYQALLKLEGIFFFSQFVLGEKSKTRVFLKHYMPCTSYEVHLCAECHISNFGCFCCCPIQNQVWLEIHYNGKSVCVCVSSPLFHSTKAVGNLLPF